MENENKTPNEETQKTYSTVEPTKKCKHCQSDISMKAKICPVCKKKQKPNGCLTAILVAIALFVLIGIIGSLGDDSDNATKSTTTTTAESTDAKPEATDTSDTEAGEVAQEEAEPSNEFNVGDIAETKDLKISYLSAEDYASDNEFLQPKDGNKYIKCDFEFENIGSTDQFVTIWDSKCYADGYACEQAYLEDDTLSATLSSGKKTKGSVFFEVPANAESIILEYDVNFWLQDKIVFIVK